MVENLQKVQAALKNRGIDAPVITKCPFIGIDFIIPAKSNMNVHKAATALREMYTQSGKTMAKWLYGKLECEGYGVDNPLSYMPYNPPNTKDNSTTTGTPINAVVITTWREKPITPGKEAVLLTSLPAEEDSNFSEINNT